LENKVFDKVFTFMVSQINYAFDYRYFQFCITWTVELKCSKSSTDLTQAIGKSNVLVIWSELSVVTTLIQQLQLTFVLQWQTLLYLE